MTRNKSRPFYFEGSGGQLLGCYHAPELLYDGNRGVVLCYPLGREYIQFHRAYRQLAVRLSQAGYPVLRFDYYGTGDSAGDFPEARIDRWLADVSTAIDALKRKAEVSSICLVGLRLGGSIALMTAVDRGDVKRLVLWDPVVSGCVYLDELTELHRYMLRHAHVRPQLEHGSDGMTEILGLSFPQSLLHDLRRLDVLSIKRAPASCVLLIESRVPSTQHLLRDHLSRIGADVALRTFHSPALWTWMEDFGQQLVPSEVLSSITSWLSGDST